ncbi:M23 family metallopeptidase [Halomonas llamarensis]|uniref:M23 family metallopeptidase n=1 Tax=Halomonas llamarensis TaxID=2945104 RepID=A0ABT0SRC5_9GAMM|nr:M23 family metallopeptidase [Halomonas llamarensis]MCL7930372.1 M23 family metallopeptidase [Halomonas llamarensis]
MDQHTVAGKRCPVRLPHRSRLNLGWLALVVIAATLTLTGCAGNSSQPERVDRPARQADSINGYWVSIQRGDTLGKLAQRADVPLERLQRFNPSADSRRLAVGQKILIPTQQERAPSGGPYRYQVRPGDTYAAIARHFGTDSRHIQRANSGVSPTALRVGQLISVPLNGASTARASGQAAKASNGSSSSAPTASPTTSGLPASARRWPWPLDDYRIVRRFGADSRGTLQPMLLATQAGAKAKAVAAGDVRFAGSMRQLGQVAIVHHPDNLQSVYALCDTLHVDEGVRVKAGDRLCDVGQNSSNQRYDLLFDLRQGGKPIDPREVLK